MTFGQTYYTSCQQGLRGGKGFQINAATDGLDPSVLQQLERLGLYVPPVSAPSRPTPEEIQQFPVSLFFQCLSEGAAVFGQARYTGEDYSGRFGNYFTHSLVSTRPEEDLKEQGILPIQLWGSDLWITEESATTSLPSLVELEAGTLITPDRVATFLHEDDRLAHLPAFLTAVESALTCGRRLVIVDKTDAIALWISAASFALPHHLVLKLTFNTYVKNPYQNDFLIVGTTTDSDFGFARHEIDHQFSVFDFKDNRLSLFSETTAFARMVAAAYASDLVREIAEFAGLVEQIAPDLTVAELDAAFAFHLRRAKIELPNVDDARLISWCAQRINNFDPADLSTLIDDVATNNAAHAGVVDAYTDLYLASLEPGSRADTRAVIELPYLTWLIRIAASEAPLAALSRTAERLQVQPSIKREGTMLLLSWIKEMRECKELARLQPFFEIAHKLGFFDQSNDSLRLIGEEIFGPSGFPAPIREVMSRYAALPGLKTIMEGIGAYLATQIGRPETFHRLAGLLTNDEIYLALARQALEQQSLPLYFQLVAARLPNREKRLSGFNECLAATHSMMSTVPGELADNAFDTIWQDNLPSFEEAIALLDSLETLAIKDSEIPRRLVDLVATCNITALALRQQELVRRLSAHRPVYQTLGDKRAIIDTYRIPAELESSGEALAQEIEASLDFLEAGPPIGLQLRAGAYAIIAANLVQVKDVEHHSILLIRGFRHGGGSTFLETYGRAFFDVLKNSSGIRAKVAARLVRIGTLVEQAGAQIIARTIFESLLPSATGDWRSKDLKGVTSLLGEDVKALRLWAKSQAIAEGEKSSGSKGWFGRLASNRRRS